MSDLSAVMFIYICLILVIVVCAVLAVRTINRNHARREESIRRKRLNDMIRTSSVRLAKLHELNSIYDIFINVDRQSDCCPYHVKKRTLSSFKSMSVSEALEQFCADDDQYGFFAQICEVRKQAVDTWPEYIEKARSIKGFPNAFKLEEIGVPLEQYIAAEDHLFDKLLLRKPVLPSVYVKISYTSPAGRNSYMKDYTFSAEQVMQCRRGVLSEREYRMSDAYRKKRARAEMTDKLRYAILKRDGFRCQICGRGQADGVKLQVDHIRPVSKGGETVESNLRTLCESCNQGKRDDWDDVANDA